MDEKTLENLLLAISAGAVTFVVTFITFQYIRPGISQVVKKS